MRSGKTPKGCSWWPVHDGYEIGTGAPMFAVALYRVIGGEPHHRIRTDTSRFFRHIGQAFDEAAKRNGLPA